MSRRLAWLGNQLWRASSAPEAWRFHRDLDRLEAVQRRVLSGLLRGQRATEFGRAFAVDRIDGYEDFRAHLPLQTYETLLPYLRTGSLSREPVRVWEPTGGSTGGSKFIPWTASLQGEFRRAVAVWCWHLFRSFPGLVGGRSYWQLTPKAEVRAPSWVQGRSGFESDGDYLGPLGRWLERAVMLAPEPGGEFWERTVAMLRGASDLRLISCWSPSFLLCLRQRFEEILGKWDPARWWPELRLISCWTSASSAPYVRIVEGLFPGVRLQGKGLLSTECVTTVPVGELYPLAYRGHFFELLDDSGELLPSWQWESGLEGRVVVTTGSGFTRYDTGDRVRVTGRLRSVPCLEFLGRHATVDHHGEKLSHAFLQSVLEGCPGFAMFGYEDGGYVLFAGREWSWRGAEVETLLMRSFTYRDARGLGQLKPLRLFRVEGDAFAQYSAACVSHLGQREGTVKAQPYHPSEKWSALFCGGFES